MPVDGWSGEGLVFLVGHPRSGTTFLGRLLGAHPEVAYWEEPDLLSEAIRLEEALRRLYRHLAVDAGLDTLPLTRGSTTDQLPVRPHQEAQAGAAARRQVRDIVHRLKREFLRRAGKDILLEKTPGEVLAIRELSAMLPDAKVIHIIRDPRDVASSTLRWIEREGWPPWLPPGDDPVEVVSDQWMAYVRAGLDAAAGPVAVSTLRHEDLLFSTTAVLRDLLGFLGLSWSSRLDDFLDRGFDGGLDRSTSGGWRQGLSADQVATVFARTGELMADLGYTGLAPTRIGRPRSKPA